MMADRGALPFSQSCENNKPYILNILCTAFAGRRQVLEIASGTGQHACHFAAAMPWLQWQPTELPDNLPLLTSSSNWLEWKEVAEGIAPPEDYENIHLHTLESSENRELFIAWVKEYVPEEVHYDLLESFLILEGSCKCYITGEAGHTRTVRLGPGDFIAMQTGETHDIRITSEQPAKAILQWVKLEG